ncbi:hypothetical protein SAY87_001294 [Trapa incisa]|uniref:Uncharacterized protein n=1 Tax=Trapa incisa TaxID=236973 RepID=A0AAN7GFY0_9MYRT|nr:hypothetical protein SAY87_001294 [Trapa incisa]
MDFNMNFGDGASPLTRQTSIYSLRELILQAYTLELEAEVTKLKELNQELQKKQDDFMEMQKNQFTWKETMRIVQFPNLLQ